MFWNEELYSQTLCFAAKAHINQKIPGSDLPYIIHPVSVCNWVGCLVGENQFDFNFLMQCAMLHDVIEDTNFSYQDILNQFGQSVADGVLALTKNNNLDKHLRMQDSLNRIKLQPPEISIVKMADRIDNLGKPPYYWTSEKKEAYRNEAIFIYNTLKGVCKTVENKLVEKINYYQNYLDEKPEV